MTIFVLYGEERNEEKKDCNSFDCGNSADSLFNNNRNKGKRKRNRKRKRKPINKTVEGGRNVIKLYTG